MCRCAIIAWLHFAILLSLTADNCPLVFLHGAGQSARTWESTPDGRDGFQNIFLRHGHPVYLLDQPRRGKAGRATVPGKITATPDDQFWFCQFRLGLWPDYYPGSQFAQGKSELNQFFRQITPNTAPYDPEVISDSVAEVFERSGPGVLVTHSQGGGIGWLTALKTDKIRGIASYEPGSAFIFPEGETPNPIASASSISPLKANSVPMEKFLALTRMPIIIFYGDYIAATPTDNPYQDHWRASLEMARKWADNISDYAATAGRRKVKLQHPENSGIQGWGDLRKAAEVIIKAVEMPDGPFHLLLGSTAVKIGEQFVEERGQEVHKWASLSIQTDTTA